MLDWGLLNIGTGSWFATLLDRVHCARFVFFLTRFWLEIGFVVFPVLIEITELCFVEELLTNLAVV